MNSTSSVDLRKYERTFVIFFVVATVVIALIRLLTELSVSGVSLLMPALAMWAAIGKFVEDHARLPDDAERARLMKVGMTTTTIITLVGLVGIWTSFALGTGAVAVIFVVCLLVNWASLRIGFWMTRNLPEAMRNKRRR
jgi:uncharacterized membrane protein YccC